MQAEKLLHFNNSGIQGEDLVPVKFINAHGSVDVDSLFYVPHIVCWGSVFGPRFAFNYLVSFLVLPSTWRGCFALTVFLMSCDCYCSMAPPQGAVGWSTVCDCCIS